MQGWANRPPVTKCTANEGKTNRFASFPVRTSLVGRPRCAFASGMAARQGEDPLTGLQRSQQPGPQGDAYFSRHRIRERHR